mmetsp:Transcript_6857/g.7823  ORF Transcript_6857/g.7823 Transcript_6857/m.7823 type:complete len:234 (+) Transcript_6857:93-794(+)
MSFGNGYNGGRTGMSSKVLLNVYDLSPANDYLYSVGFGLHHTGVEIDGREYSYGSGSGIFDGPPKMAPGARFRCQLEMGSFDGGLKEINKALDELRNNGGFGTNNYSLIRRNCNNFSNALVWLLLKRPIPSYINRLANVGDCCSCILPKQLLDDSPVGGSGNKQVPTRASMNRGQDSTNVFSGKGYSLSGKPSNGGNVTPSDLTDRREKARKAALVRLEQQTQLGSFNANKDS